MTDRVKTADLKSRFGAAKALFEDGRLIEAKDACQALLDEEPDRFEILHLTGAIAGVAGDLNMAAAFFRRAIDVNGQEAKAHLNLARVLFKQNNFTEAERTVEQAIALAPNRDDPYTVLAKVKDALNDSPAARAALTQAARLEPHSSDHTKSLARTESFFRQSKDSEETLLNALETSPNDAGLYFDLAPVHRFAPQDPLIAAMETLLQSETLDNEPKSKLLFSLGKAYDDLDDGGKAFTYLDAANGLQRDKGRLRKITSPRKNERFKSSFSKSFFNETEPGSKIAQAIIFIVGMPRSGTSLVEQVLAAHPDTVAYGEIPYLSESISEGFAELDRAKYPRDVSRLKPIHLQSIGQRYLERLSQRGSLPNVIVEKMLSNYKHAGLIRLVFPNARVVNCRRDPRAVGLSLYQHYFDDPQMAYSFDLDRIASVIQSYRNLMDHWHTVLPGFIHDLDYETFIANFEDAVRTLLEVCGLPWDDACLQYAGV